MRNKLLLALALTAGLAGCVTPPSAYVTHAFPTVQPDQISAPQQPLRLQVVTRRYRDGPLYNDASPWVYDGAVKALNKSRVILPSPQGEDGKVLVVVKERPAESGDTARGVAKGIMTGLTLGAIGSTATGQFDISLEITSQGKTFAHAPLLVDVHVRMGNADVPPGLQSYRDANDALKQALSDAVLAMLWDMQQKDQLPKP